MDTIVLHHLSSLELGESMSYTNMGVMPLYTSLDSNLQYITLKEGLRRGLLRVMEVNRYGSVPELMVLNRADLPVLLLDGEELKGAKQNRILNTTILLKKRSETIIR